MLLVAFCASLFAIQETILLKKGKGGSNTRIDKIEPSALEAARQAVRDKQAVPLIIQFSQEGILFSDSAPGRSENEAILMTEESEQVAFEDLESVYKSGAIPLKHFSKLRVATAFADADSLAKLSNDPRVAHISYDHPVQGSLNTTARAIGADQVWAGIGKTASGSHAVPPLDGTGITIAVLDSGLEGKNDLKEAFEYRTHFGGKDNDEYGHGTHVSGIIAGNGALSAPGSGYSVQYADLRGGSLFFDRRAAGSLVLPAALLVSGPGLFHYQCRGGSPTRPRFFSEFGL